MLTTRTLAQELLAHDYIHSMTMRVDETGVEDIAEIRTHTDCIVIIKSEPLGINGAKVDYEIFEPDSDTDIDPPTHTGGFVALTRKHVIDHTANIIAPA